MRIYTSLNKRPQVNSFKKLLKIMFSVIRIFQHMINFEISKLNLKINKKKIFIGSVLIRENNDLMKLNQTWKERYRNMKSFNQNKVKLNYKI